MKTQQVAQIFLAVVLTAVSLGCRAHGGAQTESVAAPGMLNPYFLEIVTPEVEATCASMEKSHGVRFGPPEPDIGGGRTAALVGGGQMSVRAPMHEAERSVVRPYLLVEDIDAAVENAVAAGGVVAMNPTALEGRGTFAIYMLGGIEHGLWQL